MQELVDRFAIVDAVYAWCRAIDTRDWAAMRDLLTALIEIDYSSNGSVTGVMTSDEWIARLAVLHGFDATLHMVTNISPNLTANGATCTSYVNAMHFVADADERELHAFACGIYEHSLVRDGPRWRISGATFRLAGRHSGRDAFDRAFDRARTLAHDRAGAKPPNN